MKVFIWISCYVVAIIINILLGLTTGIMFGVVLFFGVHFVARKLCQKWDEYKEMKEYPEGAVRVTSNVQRPAVSGWKCCCGRMHPAYVTSCVCGKSKYDPINQSKPVEAAASFSDETNQIRFCRKCGNKLIPNSYFCSKCGIRVVKE